MNGALIIDKPVGMTSHDVVAQVWKITGERRAGHTGTLDPFATGVLVILVGSATRLAQFLSGVEKEYEAVIRLGYATDTGDITGARINEFHAKTQSTPSFDKEEIDAAMASLRGEIEQTPPMYSAKKIAGKKLYELARRGEQTVRAPVRVHIKTFELLPSKDPFPRINQDGTADLRVRVTCSAGTYVRVMAEDLGRRLGIGAHLAELRRIRVGQFKIESAVTLAQLNELAPSGFEQILISPDAAVSHLPFVQLGSDELARTLHGIDVQVDDSASSTWANNQLVRMRSEPDQLVAVGIYDQERKSIHPKVVVAKKE